MKRHAWVANSKVTYISEHGKRSTKIISVTTEGFAAVLDGDQEILFDSSGHPINVNFNTETKGPLISLLAKPETVNTSAQNPWDFNMMKHMTVLDWKDLINVLIEAGYGKEKMYLKDLKQTATPEFKRRIEKVFLKIRARKDK
jgi:hypothetical protein